MKNLLRTVTLSVLLCSTSLLKAQVPQYSSYPDASSVVLFLDFDGHTVAGTDWSPITPIFCAGSGLDNNKITEIFNRVAEDYRPFGINVTTDSTKFLAADPFTRMRVIITTSSSWYGSAGGVAFVGSFGWGDDTPCFVFSQLLNFNSKNIGEAVAHEAGHTLNLYHQASYNSSCQMTSAYNYGQGSGEIGWAPIMGVGYYQNFTVWHNGPNPFGCNQLQNELDVLTTMNGFGFRIDDHKAHVDSATVASVTANQFVINGVIERNTDEDLIKFVKPSFGRLMLTAIPYNVGSGNAGSDLDLQVTLYNSSYTALNVYNPGTLLSSVIDTNLAAGTYYLKIEGRGNANAPAYASLGSYSLQGNFMTALPLHRLELQGVVNGDLHQFNWLIEADEQVVNQLLEISTDGRTFQSVTEVPSATRNYGYRPNISHTVQYRLKVTFDDGRYYYSNIITMRNLGNSPRPSIVSSSVNSDVVDVTSPQGNFQYSVHDMSGRTLTQGMLRTGTNRIVVPGMKIGLYIIRYTNGSEQWIDKFVKQ